MRLLQIKKKYPKAFTKWFNSQYAEYTVNFLYNNIRDHWKEIVDFMDKQGIKIYAYPIDKSWTYVIIGVFRIERGLRNRQQAETKAIEKAFEILEGRSKK